jgi:putative tricarboxylic transport membrane protein
MPVPLDLLLEGFAQALTPANVLYALIGCLVGTLIGVLPGIGPTSGIAILLPLSTVLPPTSAIIMMAAVYYGAMYGGSTTAIVVNIPGEASSVPTAIDGYEMAKQGRAGTALGIAAISSFVAGTLSLVGLTFFAPMLANVALSFGPPEYFALMVMSLALTISLSGRAVVKGAVALVIGLAVATIGLDPLTGLRRLTFGSVTLMAGINFVSVVIGLFAISEFMVNVEQSAQHLYDARIKNWLPTWQELRACTNTILRATGIGFALGLLPGFSPAVTTFIAYDVEKRWAKDPSRFGKGAIEGVAAAEGANNATSSGGFVPLFAFGVPASPPLAVLLGALLMYGLQPGPRLFQENPQFVWTVIASMYVGNVILLVLNLPLVGVWARIATIPFPILGPIILLSAVIGAYSIRYLLFDVWMAILFGLIGYALRKTGYPLAPIALACVLGPTLETSLKQSLILSGGSLTIFATRPLTAIILLVTCVMVGRTLWGLRSVRPPLPVNDE